jgi:putative Ca2+/H+ antiporter (TMEM165/GDT1 family)
MASSEKQTIPLEDIPVTDEGIPELQSSTTDLVDVKLPTRPRRKVVIIAGVIAVLIVVVVAASLIGKYVPEYLSEANSKCKW